ncbi:MAG: hypothetical protein LBT30_01335 [Clostridiales bacterium]|jgi:hypothetical protein|nr:hypothetical protein [Clostridiales bacterium]
MTKTVESRHAAGTKFLICGLFLVLALIDTFFKVKDYDMVKLTISAIGRTQPLWFFLWGVITSVTVLLNLFFICGELQIKTPLVYLMIINCSLSFMLPTIYIGESPFSLVIHGAGVVIFGILGYGTLIYCMIDYSIKNKSKETTAYFYMMSAVLTAAAVSYAVFGFNGVVELILLTGAEAIMLIFNAVAFCKSR